MGTGEPWKVPEQEHGLDDLICDQLVKGLESLLPCLADVTVAEYSDSWIRPLLRPLSHACASA